MSSRQHALTESASNVPAAQIGAPLGKKSKFVQSKGLGKSRNTEQDTMASPDKFMQSSLKTPNKGRKTFATMDSVFKTPAMTGSGAFAATEREGGNIQHL